MPASGSVLRRSCGGPVAPCTGRPPRSAKSASRLIGRSPASLPLVAPSGLTMRAASILSAVGGVAGQLHKLHDPAGPPCRSACCDHRSPVSHCRLYCCDGYRVSVAFWVHQLDQKDASFAMLPRFAAGNRPRFHGTKLVSALKRATCLDSSACLSLLNCWDSCNS